MRVWEKEQIETGNPKKKFLAYVIRCGHPGCEEMAVGGGSIGRWSAHDALPKVFGQKGWTVGTREKHDRCPFHTRKHAEGQRALEEQMAKPPVGFITNDVPSAARAHKPPETHIHAVIPPEQMSKQDRRIIFSKLEEVYLNEETGYSEGWSDERVAGDLGVPVAWVAEVREPNFGPNKSEQAVALLREGRALLDEIRSIHERMIDASTAFARESSALSKAMLRVEKFDKDLKDLHKRAGGK